MDKECIIVGGNLIVDYIKMIDSFPKEGNLSNILDIEKSVGGAPPNVLIDLSKIDGNIPLKAVGLVGCDEDGELIIKQLEKYNIDTDCIKKIESERTSFTDVMTIQSTGERTFFHYRGVNKLLNVNHFEFEKIGKGILHIGYALLLDKMDSDDEEYGTVMAKTLALAQKNGLKTSIDVVSENSDRFSKIVPPSLKYTNYCIINEVEASLITRIPVRDEDNKLIIKNLKVICEKLFEMGVSDWVVIHCPECGFGIDSAGNWYFQPSLELPEGYIVGTVGAGDAFCAGILYSIYRGFSMDKALKIAVSSAACNLSAANATDGMKSIEYIEKLYHTMAKKHNIHDL